MTEKSSDRPLKDRRSKNSERRVKHFSRRPALTHPHHEAVARVGQGLVVAIGHGLEAVTRN